MNATIATTRAVTAEFARRLISGIMVTGGLILIAALILGAYLITLSSWWWILESFFIFWSFIFLLLLFVSRFAMKAIAPELNKEQKHATKGFVDKLQRVSDNLATPQFVILFRIVRDSIQKREDGFIKTIASDSRTLQSDFVSLKNLF